MKTLFRCTLAVFLFALSGSPVAQAQQAATDTSQAESKPGQSGERSTRGRGGRGQSAIDVVRATGIEKSAKQVGDEAVDGKLVSWDEQEYELSNLWKERPLVITWYRGGWCPYCNRHLQAIQKSLSELEGAGARFVAITPELPENAKATAEKNELSFLVLHDKESKLAKEYGIVFDLPASIVPMYRDRLQLAKVNGYETMELPLAATYVIGTDGVIRWAFLDADYKQRAEPEDVVEAIKQLDNPQE